MPLLPKIFLLRTVTISNVKNFLKRTREQNTDRSGKATPQLPKFHRDSALVGEEQFATITKLEFHHLFLHISYIGFLSFST